MSLYGGVFHPWLNTTIHTLEAAYAQLSVLIASPEHVTANRAFVSGNICGEIDIVFNLSA